MSPRHNGDTDAQDAAAALSAERRSDSARGDSARGNGAGIVNALLLEQQPARQHAEAARAYLAPKLRELLDRVMEDAIAGGRHSDQARRSMFWLLLGMGSGRDEEDADKLDRMRQAMEILEDSKAMTEEQLFEASARFCGRYLRAHPEGWAEMQKYLPVEAAEAGKA